MSRLHLPRIFRPLWSVSLVAVALAVLMGITLQGGAVGRGYHAVPPPPTSPISANQIQNIDQVKTAIKGYYGDTTTNVPDPVSGTTMLHTFASDGAYAQEVQRVAAGAKKVLDKPGKITPGAQKAILFDVDDTLLNTYNYEIYTNFVYNPTTNAAFVNAAAFPAVPGMVDLEHYAEANGYTVFFLTGRPESQHPGTVANLTDQGYDVTDANLYLKDYNDPWLSSCAPSCTTTQYKSLTRQHIESLGYDIVANLGDQYSDLSGGFANHRIKVPNPMYYLP